MTDISTFKGLVRKFLKETGLPKTKFGSLALNDPHFIRRLWESEPRMETVEKVLRFMESYKP